MLAHHWLVPIGAGRSPVRSPAGSRGRSRGIHAGRGGSCGSLFLVFGHGKRCLDQRPVGARPVRALAEPLAERAPPALPVEQAQPMAGDVLEDDSSRPLSLQLPPQPPPHPAAPAPPPGTGTESVTESVRQVQSAGWPAP